MKFTFFQGTIEIHLPNTLKVPAVKAKSPVLLVEDMPLLQPLHQEFLKPIACDVASMGTEALQQRYDLILMDLGLPDISGIEVIQQLRADTKNQKTPIVTLTAQTPDFIPKHLLTQTETDKYEIRHRALLDVIRFFGGVTACAKQLHVSRARVSNWLNKANIQIPYEYVLLMEYLTQVSIERLSPFTESTNKAVRSQQRKEKAFELSIDKIIVEQPIHCGCCQQPHAILVGADGVLIRCLSQLETYKKIDKKKYRLLLLMWDLCY